MNQEYSQLFMPKLITGRGSISFFASLGKKRIGVIRGGRSLNNALKTKIEKLAEVSGAEVRYLAQIRNEPFIEDIFQCMEDVRAFEPDMILAIGGGSVLDTAKAIHLFYENPNMQFEDALIPYTLPALGEKAVHISVPTTSGTGSEATSVAVFIDSKTATKKLIMDNTLIPHYAILDADTTDSLPSSITIATGMDALTHAIESSVATNASALSKALALEAAMDILENLVLAADVDPAAGAGSASGMGSTSDMGSVSDIDSAARKWKSAKEKVHIASALAGIAITNSCTGIAHSYDHPGPAFSLPHGTVCGLMLPYTMALCGSQPTYATLAKRLGYSGDEAALSNQLIQHLLEFVKTLGLKTSFQELGIDEADYLSRIDAWCTGSLSAFATVVSPAQMTVEKGIELYKACYYGNLPKMF